MQYCMISNAGRGEFPLLITVYYTCILYWHGQPHCFIFCLFLFIYTAFIIFLWAFIKLDFALLIPVYGGTTFKSRCGNGILEFLHTLLLFSQALNPALCCICCLFLKY